MIFSVACLLARRLLGCLMVLARREVSKNTELLVLGASERGAAPPDRAAPLPADRPAVARGTVAADPPAPLGRGVRGDPCDAAGLAPALLGRLLIVNEHHLRQEY